MGIWNRLESVIKSYIHDDTEKIVWRKRARERSDPDLDAAYEELDDFLRGGSGGAGRNGTAESGRGGTKRHATPIPDEIKRDFAELGLSPGATAEECKEAYKKLLKLHHPDRHANHPGNMKKATEKTARVNAAYERLETWLKIQAGG